VPGRRGEFSIRHAKTHNIIMSKIRRLNVANISFAAKGHPCAEDCGGAGGWEDLKELFAKPRMRDEDDRRQWYKEYCANGDPKGLNPYAWSILDVNQELEAVKQ
jgi:hypothetical protein